MKLIINYDLVERISEAKNGMKLIRILQCAAQKRPVASIGLLSAMVTLTICCPLVFIPLSMKVYSAYDKWNYENKDSEIQKATVDLEQLVRQLYNLNVYTTLELLKKAKVTDQYDEIVYVSIDIKSNTFKYLLKKNSVELPVLKQHKFINVEQTNGMTETLHQIHFVGYKDYELSVGEPEREPYIKRQLKSARMGV